MGESKGGTGRMRPPKPWPPPPSVLSQSENEAFERLIGTVRQFGAEQRTLAEQLRASRIDGCSFVSAPVGGHRFGGPGLSTRTDAKPKQAEPIPSVLDVLLAIPRRPRWGEFRDGQGIEADQ